MTDAQIIEKLRLAGSVAGPVASAELLDELASVGLSQASLITSFKRAFPQIPLRTLQLAGGWSRLSAGKLSDDDFNELLSPWLPTECGG